MSAQRFFLGALLLLTTLGACAQQVGDIDRTQPNRLRKADLDGVWYMMDTVTDLPSTSRATFIGETSRTEKIVWVVEESYLLAYRAYPLVPGTDDVDGNYDYTQPTYRESPVAAFPILSHFDIQRQYDASTGEQYNVIDENTSDRPWYEREFIRVDWSTNAVTNFDFISGWFVSPVEASYAQDPERGLATSVYFELDDDENLVYFDAPRRLLLEPDWWGCILAWYGYSAEDCAPAEVEIVSSFARTEPRRDYEPLPYSDQDLGRFGYFRSERYVFDPQRGVLESTRRRMGNRFNLFQASYRRNDDGSFATDGEGRLVPIPIAERQVRTIPYYMSANYPDDTLLRSAAQDTLAQWNTIAREAVAVAQGISIDQVPNVFILCNNPVVQEDPAECGAVGFAPRPGDLRYSTLYWVETEQLEGPLGYGPAAVDPETGEILAGRAFVYGSGINTYASYAVDVLRFINGDLDPDELIDADHIRAEVLRRSEQSANMDRVAPELRDIPLEPRRTRPTERMVERESRRRDLRHFDREAAMRRLESLHEEGRSILGGDELERALTARAGMPLDQLPTEARAALEPTNWLSPTHLSELRRRQLRAMARGVDFADMIDPHVVGLARTYQGRTDYEQIWRELRAELFRSTALHEVGHTVGLRHNFQGTYDSLNYHNEYWSLRGENLFAPSNMYEMYELSALTEAQTAGRMREYQYSSIMDYGYTFATDAQGLGKYDRAAFVFGYTAGTVARDASGGCEGLDRRPDPADSSRCLVREPGFVEVFAKPANELGRAGEILTSRDELGFRFDDATAPFVPYLERWHYTTFMRSFPAIQDAFNREWMRLSDYHASQGTGGDRVRVPYLFCSDEYVGSLLSCQVYDAGADPFEQTLTAIDSYRGYYYFTNFKRDRLGWDVIDPLFWNFYYVFLPLSDYFQSWYLSPEGADAVMDDYYWLAINAGINLLSEILATPPYGTFCTGTNGELVQLSDEPGRSPAQVSDYYLNAYCNNDEPFFEVAQGDGRRRFSTYDVTSGYNYPYLPLEAGHYWTTLAAFWALTDPEAYVLGTDGDLGVFSISYYDFFRDEVIAMANRHITENYAEYSPVMQVTGTTEDDHRTGVLHYPVLSPVFDEVTGTSFDPETGRLIEGSLGPSRQRLGICEPCETNADCNGGTGFLGGTFCQPVEPDSDELFCLQDCSADEGLCDDDEICDDFGNCVPEDGSCKDDDIQQCSSDEPRGACPEGQSCYEGACADIWPTVQTDATFALTDDMIFYGMYYTTFSYSTRYNDQLNVFKLGTDETVDPGQGFELISFTDPISGDEYGAIIEDCDGPDDALTLSGGPQGMCEACEEDTECAGHTGFLGGTYCQPLVDADDEVWYCLQDCSENENACPAGTSCNNDGNCVPDDMQCGSLVSDCSETNPIGACDDGFTCHENACVDLDLAFEPSSRCRFGLSRQGGGAQMVLRGQELARRHDETLAAYWSDDGSDPDREYFLFTQYSRASFELETLVEKINLIRAIYAIFGTVY